MKPLSSKKRKALFITLIFIFVVFLPGLLLYSAGYRLDDARNIISTGGIFIHSDLANTEVFIDGEIVDTNGIILRNTLVKELRPGKTYSITVEKEGYHAWHKELLVLPNLVTEATLMMLPREIEYRIISKEVENTSTTTLISSIENPEYTSVQRLFTERIPQFLSEVATTTTDTLGNTVTGTTTAIVFPKDVLNASINDLETKENVREKQDMLAWLENGKIYTTWVGKKENTPFIFCKEECNGMIVVTVNGLIENYDFFPGRNDVFVIQTADGVYAIEADTRSVPNIQSLYTYKNDGVRDFVVENNNTLFVQDGDIFFEVLL